MLSGDYKFITHLFSEMLIKFVILRAWNVRFCSSHYKRLIVLFVIVYACVYVCVLGVVRAGRVLGECSSPWNTVIYREL